MDINNTYFVTKCNNDAKKAYGHFATNLFSSSGSDGMIVEATTNAGSFLRDVLQIAKNKQRSGFDAQVEMDKIYENYKTPLQLDDAFKAKLKVEVAQKVNSDKLRNLSTKTIEAFESTSGFAPLGSGSAGSSEADKTPAPTPDLEAQTLPYVRDMVNFFSEFEFPVSMRFIDTFARLKTLKEKKSYVINYFALSDDPSAEAIKDKVKSSEFKDFADNIKIDESLPPVNSRLEIIYGPQGTFKTTEAKKRATITMICASDMFPKTVLENFLFNDENGHPQFAPSELWIAMETGQTLLMDEFNMLPFETHRFLQGLLDGKDSFNFDGKEIRIDPNFKVIATMNLDLKGQRYGLPAPLVDRACVLKELVLSPEQLCHGLFHRNY